VPLAPDDPAREKIAELKARNASPEEIMEALDTFEVSASYLVKALSPGHAKLIVGEMIEHMVQTHVEPGTLALSTVQDGVQLDWLDGPLDAGE
jgi:hypothetical protein